MKRILSALLLLSLLAGCAPGGDGGAAPAPMGRYIETEGEALPNVTQLYDFHAAADGSIIFYVNRTVDGANFYERCVLQAADGSVQSAPAEWLNALAGEGYAVIEVSEGADGLAYALGMNYETGGKILVRTQDGAAWTPVAVAAWESPAEGAQQGESAYGGSVGIDRGGVTAAEGSAAVSDGGDIGVSDDGGAPVYYEEPDAQYPIRVAAAPDGGFFALFMEGGAVRYGADGAELARFPGAAYQHTMALRENTLVLAGGENELWVYDVDGARQTGTHTFDGLSMGAQVGLDGAGLYLGEATGVYRQSENGTLWEKLVDGDLTSLAMPNQALLGLAPDGDGGFWGVMGSDETYRLVRYQYSADMPTNPDTELTIFALKDSATVRQTIGEFQRRNPNVRVNLRVAQAGDSSATTEDLIRALNTELLSGKGPDLLVLDGLPVDSYMEKGVLLDLTDLVGEWVSSQGLMENLMGAFGREGRLYGVPSRFSVPLMVGERAAVDGITSLEDLVEQTLQATDPEHPFLFAPSSLWEDTGVLMEYYDFLSAGWTGDGDTLDQAALAAYLAAMVKLDGALRALTPEVGDGSAMVTVTATSIGAGGFELLDGGPGALAKGDARFTVLDLAGMVNLQNLVTSLEGLEGYQLAPLFGGDLYRPQAAVGIVASGSRQELAKAFVELMLSETVQDKYLYDGLPVNGRSLDKMVSDMLEGADDLGFTALCRTLKTPMLTDQVVREAVERQLKPLLDGELTPQAAAEQVDRDTELYRAE